MYYRPTLQNQKVKNKLSKYITDNGSIFLICKKISEEFEIHNRKNEKMYINISLD